MTEGGPRFPAKFTLGGHQISLRYMRVSDRNGMLTFARALPEKGL